MMRCFIVAYLLLSFTIPLFGQKKGEAILVTAAVEAKLRMSNPPGATIPRGIFLRVEDINGNWFWVKSHTSGGKLIKGWIARSDVTPLSKVIDFYTTAIQQKPNVDDYMIRATLWVSKGAYNKAIKDYNEVIRLAPKNVLAWHNRGVAWANKKKYDKAIKDYSEAIRLDPKNVPAWNGLAWLHATCPNENFRDGVQAVKEARHACQITEWKNAAYIDTYAVALAEVGQFGKAIKQIEKAMTLSAEYAKEDGPKMLKLFKAKQSYHKE